MMMNIKYDTYLLYEYMKKVSFTVRILVKLNESIDPDLLMDQGDGVRGPKRKKIKRIRLRKTQKKMNS